MNFVMDNRTSFITQFGDYKNTLYLIQRDNRIFDNHAFNLAVELAEKSKGSLYVGTELNKIKMNERQKVFLMEGLQELEKACIAHNIFFYLINDIDEFIELKEISCIITDFSPLRENTKYNEELEEICQTKKITFGICDAHNMVPCKLLKVYKKTGKAVKAQLFKYWDDYFEDMPAIKPYKYNNIDEVMEVRNNFIYKSKDKCSSFKGGYTAGMKEVEEFFEKRFSKFSSMRNNPNVNAQSNLSPWIHSGQISSQKIIFMACKRFKKNDVNLSSFLNEIFAWKEIAEHYCYHEKNYDNLDGALPWAKETLLKHKNDKRDEVYSSEDLEAGKTKDPLWNAAQKELLTKGKIHGYVRMYWAKQLLKWKDDPEDALKITIELNDKYSIDGNDPNGYTAIMWCICGAMDQGFKERNIVGKIRPMSSLKLKASDYIQRWNT
uniref:Deoxyribodipyrimidine photo-lyase n=1 Tax=Strongyloides papillosus TaxID=174720 RepID=A0A0N5BW79_STREA